MTRKPPLESSRESTLIRHGERRGVMVLKVMAISRSGFPDRMCFARPGRVAFAELKQEKKNLEPLQKWWRKKLTEFGFIARRVRTIEDIEAFYEDWLGPAE